MSRKMRRYLASAAAVPLLLGSLLTGTASASTTTPQGNPTPYCNPWALIGSGCTCPPGWHVVWPPWWTLGFGSPSCDRNN